MSSDTRIISNATVKAYILVDQYSRSIVKCNFMEFNRIGIKTISSFSDVTEEMLNECNKIILMESYLRNPDSIASIHVYQELLNIDFLMLGVTDLLLNQVSGFIRVFKCDYVNLDTAMLNAALYNDINYSSDGLSESHLSVIDTICDTILNSEISDTYTADIKSLAATYVSLFSQFNDLMLNYQKQSDQIATLEAQCATLSMENNRYRYGYTTLLKDSIKLNNTLKDYEGILTKDIYDKVSLSQYQDAPLIIYVKEYEELNNTWLFLSTLFEIIRMQLHKSVKLLALYDSKTSKSMHTVPDYVKCIYNNFYAKDVLSNDFIAKAGDYTEVLNLLLTNRTNLNVLIIADFKSILDVVISGPTIGLNLCREASHKPNFGLKDVNTIVNYAKSEADLVFNETQNDEKLPRDRFLALSALPVYKSILRQIEIFQENV